jgi:hypothetical protein
MHFYVPEAVARRLRARARAAGMSVSKYLASIVAGEGGQDWPPEFFSETVGGWRGKALRRAPQGKVDRREDL